jgi:hypothetical protein
MSKLIRVVQGGKQVREIRLDAILGKFFDRLEKAHGTVEISDPDLESKLDESELNQLYAKFPELNPNRPLPPKPSTEPIAFREDVVVEEVSDVEELTNEEIVEWLVANDIEFDKRKKNNTDYLIQIITENEN